MFFIIEDCGLAEGFLVIIGWLLSTVIKYLVMVPCLGGGCGVGGGEGSGGGGGWLLGLPAKILWKVGFGLIVMLVLTHSLTPVLNLCSFVSFLRHSSSLL